MAAPVKIVCTRAFMYAGSHIAVGANLDVTDADAEYLCGLGVAVLAENAPAPPPKKKAPAKTAKKKTSKRK